MRRISVGVAAAAILSDLLVLGGVMLLRRAQKETASFGWFADQPIAGAAFFPGSLVVLTPLTAAGAAICVAGLVGLGVIAGLLLGRRHSIGR